jgi:predicted negative regulator of RcsB-dependent stress response
MLRNACWQIALLVYVVAWAPAVLADSKPRDLYFSEALYYAQQGLYFEALARLDVELAQHNGLDEPKLDSLYPFVDSAQFSVGDFELNYRMHLRAGHAITAVLEGNVDESIRNDAAYRLARIQFQKGQLADALHSLDRIHGRVPENIRDDIEFLRANLYLSTAHPDDATPILKRLQGDRKLLGFPEYNLAIAYLQGDRRDAALQQLDKAGAVDASDDETRAIRDKANLVRGTLLLESGQFADAKNSLDRVRLEGPFSNQALLSAGWADVSAQHFEGAVVPWNILVQRNRTDPAVQEAMLALPYAYGQLAVYGRAAMLYSQALQAYGAERDKLHASIDSIRAGKFLKALVREEIRKDKDWVVRLRSLPETPETYYLMELLASHDFQSALQNYLDLEDLRRRLDGWQRSFAAYEDLIQLRRAYYEPLLPGLDQQFRDLDSRRRLRLEQQKILAGRLQNMLIAPRPELLATADEQLLTTQLNTLEQRINAGATPDANLLARVGRLRGLVTWDLKTQYHERLTQFYEHLQESQKAVETLNEQYNEFVRVRQAATHSYVGYDTPIKRLRTRVGEAIQQTKLLMARQGNVLEQVAVAELQVREQRLENYEVRARYAMADSYDRATAVQRQAPQQ